MAHQFARSAAGGKLVASRALQRLNLECARFATLRAERPRIRMLGLPTPAIRRRYSSSSSSPPPDERERPISSEMKQPENIEKPSVNINKGDPLPSHTESRRHPLSHNFSAFMDRAQTTLFAASQRINDLTGYSGIETLKSHIARLEADLQQAQADHHAARAAYQSAVSERSATQREVTTLLARQKTWSPDDFERFTALYRTDYELEAAVTDTGVRLSQTEHEAERLGRELSTGILSRYHEEQIWSDKIRRMSTWGTWGLMGVNVLLFLVFQFGAEPWRRSRLVKGFEEKVREALVEEREHHDRTSKEREKEREGEREREMETVYEADIHSKQNLPDGNTAPTSTTNPDVERETTQSTDDYDKIPPMTWKETIRDPARWRAVAEDLASHRRVTLSMRDISIVALEGVAAGATLTGSMVAAVLLLRRT